METKIDTKSMQEFPEFNFELGSDLLSAFGKKGCPIYFIMIGATRGNTDNFYLVINKYGHESKANIGFDLWLATYKKDQRINEYLPSGLILLKQNFKPDIDKDLIKHLIIMNP